MSVIGDESVLGDEAPVPEGEPYGTVEYWNTRYKTDPAPFDWLQRLDGLRNVIKDNLLAAGYTNITNVDWSPVATEIMQKRHSDTPRIRWLTMDVCQLNFPNPNTSFDVIIEKGTLDCLACGPESGTRMAAALAAICRLLRRPNGKFISVSWSRPSVRTAILAAEAKTLGWKLLSVHDIPKPVVAAAKPLIVGESLEESAAASRAASSEVDSKHHVYVMAVEPPPS
eukprot:m51a1_g2489 hypothetical protein (226) ;mRNA; f:89578-90446